MADAERTMTIYEKADNLMYNHDLLGLLQKYGNVSIVGSYRMGSKARIMRVSELHKILM